MRKKIKALLPACFILFIVFTIIGCDKDFTAIDSDVIGEDNANFNTEGVIIPIRAYNKKLDSVQISNLGSNLLGVFKDPAYGITKASIVTQITPTLFNPNFGIKPAIDSVILTIPYYSRITGANTETGVTTYTLDSLYGNPEAKFKLSIYQNNYFLRSFNPDAPFGEAQRYYSNANNADKTINSAITENSTINFDNQKGALISLDTIQPSSKEIIITSGSGDTATSETLEPSLRIEMDTTVWHNEIIKKQGTSALSNPNNFLNHFRGLYFKVEQLGDDGNMVLLNLADTKSNITIYYSRDTSASDNTRVQSIYTLNFSGNKLNTFVNEFDFPLENGNKTDGDELLYLKNVGSMAVVDLFGNEDLDDNGVPDALDDLRTELKDGANQNALINEAQLIIYEDENIPSPSTHTYDRIYAYDIKNRRPIIDYSIDQSTNVNTPLNSKFIHLGQRRETGEGTNVWKYKIRITEHLNRLIFQDSTNTKIGLVISNNVNLINNAIILNSEDGVTSIPAASIISPKGTILYGSNETVGENRMILKIFFTKPK